MDAFSPLGSTVAIANATTAGTSRVQLTAVALPSIRVFNGSDRTLFIEFGASDVTASTATSTPVGAGTIEIFAINSAATHIAAVASGSAAVGSIYFTSGRGV